MILYSVALDESPGWNKNVLWTSTSNIQGLNFILFTSDMCILVKLEKIVAESSGWLFCIYELSLCIIPVVNVKEYYKDTTTK